MRHVETMETRRMMSLTTPDALLAGGTDTRAAGNETAVEELVIVHEGFERASRTDVSEILVFKLPDTSDTLEGDQCLVFYLGGH